MALFDATYFSGDSEVTARTKLRELLAYSAGLIPHEILTEAHK